MQVIINSESIRIDGTILRFLVQYPEIVPGYHGVQTSLPTTVNAVKAAILQASQKLQANKDQIDTWKTNFAAMLDTPLEIS